MLAAGIDEHARGGLAQVTEADFYRAKGELRDNGFQRDRNHRPGRRGLHYFCAQIQGQSGKD